LSGGHSRRDTEPTENLTENLKSRTFRCATLPALNFALFFAATAALAIFAGAVAVFATVTALAVITAAASLFATVAALAVGAIAGSALATVATPATVSADVVAVRLFADGTNISGTGIFWTIGGNLIVRARA
jgi:hypothetical protein